MAVNTTWVDPTKTEANGGIDLVTGNTLDQTVWERMCSNLNALGGSDGRRVAYRREWVQGTTIASAATTDLSTVEGNYVQVSGTTTITALGTLPAGTVMVVEFQGALTLTYNGTSLILMGAVNATTTAGDVFGFVSEGSGNWRELFRRRATPQFADLPATRFKLLNTSRDMTAASGTASVAHGITGTPKFAVLVANVETIDAASWGASDGTTNNCVRQIANTGVTTIVVENLKTTAAVWLGTNNNGTDTDYQFATVTFDSTNVNLVWTKTGAPTGTGEVIIALYF